MHVIHLSTGAQLGGAERSLLEMLASLRAAEPSWTLSLVTPREGPLAERARRLGVETIAFALPHVVTRLAEWETNGRSAGRVELLGRLAVSLPSAAACVRRLGRVFRRLRPQVLHAHGFKMQVLAARARPRGASLVWHVHDYLGRRPITARVLRVCAGRTRMIVTNSASVERDVRAAVGPRIPTAVLYNAVNLEQFSPAGPALDLDALSGLPPAPPGTIRVGLVATLARWKGHRVFLEAIASVPAECRIRAYVIGGPLYATAGSQHTPDELRERARDLGLTRRLGFTGFIDDVAAAIRALDVVVHASTEPEPFGMVIAEAMACGRPVVASRAGGAVEIVEDGRDALTHCPGDVRGLAAAIERLASDESLRAHLGRTARATAERRFNRARLAAELAPLYRELTQETKYEAPETTSGGRRSVS